MDSLPNRTLIKISISTSELMPKNHGIELSQLINQLIFFPTKKIMEGGDSGMVFIHVEEPDGGRMI